MTTNEDAEILSAVIGSRDALSVDLDNQLLEEIVDLETTMSDPARLETALRKAIEDAISRGVGSGGDR